MLTASGILSVSIAYDGAGDEGQIERVDAIGETGAVKLPDLATEIRMLQFDGTTAVSSGTLEEAITAFGYEVLEAAHDGWENNDGAFGELTIDVPARQASLEHNHRTIAINTETLELGEVPCPTPTTTH